MKSCGTSLPGEPANLEQPPVFKVFILYQDLDCGLHAMKTYQGLNRELHADCDFRSTLWKAEMLGLPQFRPVMTEEALEADMIILGVRADHTLGERLLDWLGQEVARGRPEDGKALVLVLNTESAGPAQGALIRHQLAELAARRGMEFFACTVPSGTAQQPISWETVDRRVNCLTPLLQNCLYQTRSSPRWGINE